MLAVLRIQAAAESIKPSSAASLASDLYLLYLIFPRPVAVKQQALLLCVSPSEAKKKGFVFRKQPLKCLEGVSRKQSAAGGAGAALTLSANPAQHQDQTDATCVCITTIQSTQTGHRQELRT
ncbi:hypothetical protein PAMP_021592 [Pampus punctatissimus]